MMNLNRYTPFHYFIYWLGFWGTRFVLVGGAIAGWVALVLVLRG